MDDTGLNEIPTSPRDPHGLNYVSFFRPVQTSVQIFLYGELDIIWKPRSVKICEHSIFLIIEHKYV